MEVDADGFGRAAITELTLGSIEIGLFTVPIERVEFDATLTILGVGQLLGDYDGDGIVGLGDYDVWKSTLSSTTDLRADGNEDGRVTVADYSIWRSRLDSGPVGSGAALASIPEPVTWILLASSIAFLPRRKMRAH